MSSETVTIAVLNVLCVVPIGWCLWKHWRDRSANLCDYSSHNTPTPRFDTDGVVWSSVALVTMIAQVVSR